MTVAFTVTSTVCVHTSHLLIVDVQIKSVHTRAAHQGSHGAPQDLWSAKQTHARYTLLKNNLQD